MAISYGGSTLSDKHIDRLVEAGQTYGTPPSLYISQLYYESNWGTSPVAVANNNWGGLTWTGNPNRPSGIVVSRGTQREEGGYYMRFASVDDYFTDYIYLINEQGIYNTSGHDNFEDSVKGLFIAGGALRDYASTPWQTYVPTMVSIRNGINRNNGNILDDLDSGISGGGKPCFPTSEGSVITSKYGWRKHPITGLDDFHSGTDFAHPSGTSQPIYATQSGVVIRSGFISGGGNMVAIRHTGDPYFSMYLHMIRTPDVKVGDIVTKCQKIGDTGTTGSSTGIHLHFEIATSANGFDTENGTIDPEDYLKMSFHGGGGGGGETSKDDEILRLLLSGALNGWYN